MAARCYSQSKAQGWQKDVPFEIAEVRRLARKAVELGPDDPIALSASGMALAYVAGDLDAGDVLINKSLELNPNFAWPGCSVAGSMPGAEKPKRPSAGSPGRCFSARMIRTCPTCGGRLRSRISLAAAMRKPFPLRGENPNPAKCNLRIGDNCRRAALLGRQVEAERAASDLRLADPSLRLAHLRERFPMTHKKISAVGRKDCEKPDCRNEFA